VCFPEVEQGEAKGEVEQCCVVRLGLLQRAAHQGAQEQADHPFIVFERLKVCYLAVHFQPAN
jgi:hypothetical protein